MKKILPYLENKKFKNAHFMEIKRNMDTLNPIHVEGLHNKNGVTGLMYNYAMSLYNITKFLRTIYKADIEPKVKKVPYIPPKPLPETRIVNEEEMNMIIGSKNNKRFDQFKVKLHSDIFNENLMLSVAESKGHQIEPSAEAEPPIDINEESAKDRIKQLKRMIKEMENKQLRDQKGKIFTMFKLSEELNQTFSENS